MYMLLDVNSPLVGDSLNTGEPWASYYAAYLNRTFAVVEAFSNYPNTLLFFSGNEVISDVTSAKFVPPYLRAVTRDLKTYIKNHISRQIPVGYSAADVRDVLFDTWNYLQCDNGDSSAVDIFALNSYSWCGNSDFKTSTYQQLVAGFQSSSVPVFFSEYGCNMPAPRIFTEVGTIYGDQMTGVMSGGLVYEYSQEPSNYGLVTINSDGSVQLLPDYHTLASQYAKLDFSKVEGGSPPGSTPKAPKCSPSLITEAGFNNNFTIPATPTSDASADILNKGVNPKPSGKLVQITDWNVKLTVKDVDGSVIKTLAVKPLADDQSNQPGSNSAPTSTATGSATNPTTSTKGAGSYLQPSLLAFGVPLLALLFV
jgi:1,3-beta-glucanosyltransferase GAS3